MLTKEQEEKAREIAADIAERAAMVSLVGDMESKLISLGKSCRN